MDGGFQLEVDGGLACHHVVFGIEVFAAGEGCCVAADVVASEQDDCAARVFEGGGCVRCGVLQEAERADNGGGVYVPPVRLVVQADVSADYRRAQRGTGVGHPSYALFELIVDLRLLWVAEVQTIRQGDGFCPYRRDIAARLCDCEHSSDVGIQAALSSVAVGSEREADGCVLDAEHRCIRARRDDGVGLDLVIVLTVDGVLAGNVGRCEKSEEDVAGRVGGQGHGLEVESSVQGGGGRFDAGESVGWGVRQ